uniref:uncharacterized protein LOC118521578 n=1 Tax=Halichoerus grypus TaxID=9711 RepID=UPI00165A1291|nr:uncharacterized protein LOC118521578 [Halichoerus grypus]
MGPVCRTAGDKRPSLHRGRRAPTGSSERQALPALSPPTWPGLFSPSWFGVASLQAGLGSEDGRSERRAGAGVPAHPPPAPLCAGEARGKGHVWSLPPDFSNAAVSGVPFLPPSVAQSEGLSTACPRPPHPAAWARWARPQSPLKPGGGAWGSRLTAWKEHRSWRAEGPQGGLAISVASPGLPRRGRHRTVCVRSVLREGLGSGRGGQAGRCVAGRQSPPREGGTTGRIPVLCAGGACAGGRLAVVVRRGEEGCWPRTLARSAGPASLQPAWFSRGWIGVPWGSGGETPAEGRGLARRGSQHPPVRPPRASLSLRVEGALFRKPRGCKAGSSLVSFSE